MNIERAKLSCKNCKWYVKEEEYFYGKKEKVSKCAICDDYDFNVEYTKFSNNDEFLVIGTINQNFGRISAGFVGF